jgi:ribosomal protein S18 acetylase RimI-like enzyme
MNFDDIKKSSMNEEYARQITEWNYEGEYSDYNLPSYEECKNKKYGMTREDRWNNYIVYTINNEVVFYSNMKEMDNNKLYIGVGLKPKYCGKGLGNFFLNDSINEMKKIYPERTFFLEVRSWNKRAIKSYEKLGFKITNTVISKDRLGNDTEFIEMEM